MSNHAARRGFLKTLAGGSAAMSFLGSATPAAAEDKFLASERLGEFRMFYEVHGEGPAIVFAHGAGGNHMSWWQQVPVLSPKYKCVTIDHRGYGFSHDLPGGPGGRSFVPDLTALLDKLGIQRVALVGQSMGGTTVLGFASQHPERVSALVMSDTNGGYTNAEIEQVRRNLPPAPKPAGMTDREWLIARAVAPDFPKREPAKMFLYREISSATIPPDPAPAAAAPATPAPKADLAPILAKKVPVLFIVGAEDRLIAPPIIEAMHRAMPGSEMVKVAGAGHSPYFEKPEEYNKILTEFLAKHVTA